MKRWLTHLTIAGYLSVLAYGVVAHAVAYKVAAHPGMYFIVWDMFCGWASHASRMQVIGEGESGRYYRLAPGPWGEFKPFGDIGRRHYDTFGLFAADMAENCLEHTHHEPMTRIFVVEECWPKKYNLPERIWRRRHHEPKDIRRYYHVRKVLDGQGNLLKSNASWLSYQNALCVADNPRLQADARRGKPFFHVPPSQRMNAPLDPGGDFDAARRAPAASRLGN